MTSYTNTRDNSTLAGVGFKDGDDLTTANGSRWVYQNEQWHPVTFGGSPSVQPLTVTTTSAQGIEFDAGADAFGLAKIYPLYQTVDGLGVVEFVKTAMSALAASSTVSQSGNTVTVICGGASPVAHNIASSAAGGRIVFPGSETIPQGIYPGFVRVDANTFTFSRSVAATVATELVNAGAAFVASLTIATRNIKGGSIGKNGRVTLRSLRGGGTTSSTFQRVALASTSLHGAPATASPFGEIAQSFRALNSELEQVSAPGIDGVLAAGAPTVGAVDTTVDQTLAVSWQCSAAQAALWVLGVEVEIVKK